MFFSYGIDAKRSRNQSPIKTRVPLDFEELCQCFIDPGNLSHNEVAAALKTLEDYLGHDIRRMRPSDRFDRELAYLQAEVFDNDLDALWLEISCEFLLNERESELLWSRMSSVQDFVEIHAFLNRQIPGKVDLGSFCSKI